MTITKSKARQESRSKWHKIKSEFLDIFTGINSPCGLCVYCIERSDPKQYGHRCKLCRQEFPEVYRICKEMVDFFGAKHGALDKMIDAIIKEINEVKV